MRWTNYHSHTLFSDGSHTPEHYIVSAIEQKMLAYGFSGHAPVSFQTEWTIKPDKLYEYLNEIDRLREKYQNDISVFKSLEIDYLPGNPMTWEATRKSWNLDYVIGSVHFVGLLPDGMPWNIDYSQEIFDKGVELIYNNSLKKAVEKFYELSSLMLGDMKPDILGHLDKIKMFCMKDLDQSAKWYRILVSDLLQQVKAAGTIVELNTRGFYKKTIDEFYPSAWILKEIKDLGIPITICSDSHHPSELTGGFTDAAELLEILGFKTLSVLEKGAWVQKQFSCSKGIVM